MARAAGSQHRPGELAQGAVEGAARQLSPVRPLPRLRSHGLSEYINPHHPSFGNHSGLSRPTVRISLETLSSLGALSNSCHSCVDCVVVCHHQVTPHHHVYNVRSQPSGRRAGPAHLKDLPIQKGKCHFRTFKTLLPSN